MVGFCCVFWGFMFMFMFVGVGVGGFHKIENVFGLELGDIFCI